MIKVHHLGRSRSLRIVWLLEELGLEYEIVRYERDPVTNLAPPELLAVHPLGKSPMIELDGMLVTESAAIVEVICARHAPDMVPAVNTEGYIRHLEMMHFAEGSAMTPILLGLYMGKLGAAAEPLGPRIQQQLDSHYSYMETLVRPSGHFVMDHLSAADIMLSFPAEIAIRQKRGADYPKLASFVDAMQGRDAYQRAVAKAGV